jgi:hypothetical protein
VSELPLTTTTSQCAMCPHVMADVAKYTDIAPVMQISEVVT